MDQPKIESKIQPNIQLVVFDMAGTTVQDSQTIHQSLQRALADFGVTIHLAEINPLMGYPKPVAIKILLESKLGSDPIITDTYVDRIHTLFVELMVDFYQKDPSVAEKPEASYVFQMLRQQGIQVALDTGFNRLITNTLLQRLGWIIGQNIDASVSSDEVSRGRPYPDMIFRAMALTGVTDPKAVMKVGDTASDMQQGKAAGCSYVVGVTTGAFAETDLAQENPTHLIRHLTEILEMILGDKDL
jgi:phosphonatase-like hydrolase